MLARSSVPGLGAQCAPAGGTRPDSYMGPGQWQISVGYRYQHSHRHFVGKDEQEEREEQESEVVNRVHLLDFAATYAVTQRFNVTLSVPFLYAKQLVPGNIFRNRVPPIDAPDQHSQGIGIGDVALTGRFWLIRLSRNRQRSVTDIRDGRHGDAAFADYFITVGYSRRF